MTKPNPALEPLHIREDSQIAARLGMSRHMVRKIRLRAEKKIRKALLEIR